MLQAVTFVVGLSCRVIKKIPSREIKKKKRNLGSCELCILWLVLETEPARPASQNRLRSMGRSKNPADLGEPRC